MICAKYQTKHDQYTNKNLRVAVTALFSQFPALVVYGDSPPVSTSSSAAVNQVIVGWLVPLNSHLSVSSFIVLSGH